MENASKALIIAGAILISILLISVGIIIMNAINSPVEQTRSESESQAIEIFNSKFTGYLGPGQSPNSIKTLLTTINSSNGSDATHQISTDGSDVNTFADIQARHTYTVDAFDDGTDGMVAGDGFYDHITIMVDP